MRKNRINKKSLERLSLLLNTAKEILILSHINPEGDAIGSQLALGLSLLKFGKKVHNVNINGVPENLLFLPGIQNIKKGLPSSQDLIIVVDTSDLSRTGFRLDNVKGNSFIINIDHHITNAFFGDLNIVDPDASATGILIYKIIKGLELPKDTDILMSIYTAIYIDTGSFSFQNVNREVFKIAEELVKEGVSPSFVAEKLNEENPLQKYKLLNLALGTIRYLDNLPVATMLITKDMMQEADAKNEDTEGFINYVKGIKGVKIGVLVKELEGNKWKISLRSKAGIDVAGIAERFGGGGHTNASGFEFRGSLEVMEKNLIDEIKKVL